MKEEGTEGVAIPRVEGVEFPRVEEVLWTKGMAHKERMPGITKGRKSVVDVPEQVLSKRPRLSS